MILATSKFVLAGYCGTATATIRHTLSPYDLHSENERERDSAGDTNLLPWRRSSHYRRTVICDLHAASLWKRRSRTSHSIRKCRVVSRSTQSTDADTSCHRDLAINAGELHDRESRREYRADTSHSVQTEVANANIARFH